jgi:hypothetical protein
MLWLKIGTSCHLASIPITSIRASVGNRVIEQCNNCGRQRATDSLIKTQAGTRPPGPQLLRTLNL